MEWEGSELLVVGVLGRQVTGDRVVKTASNYLRSQGETEQIRGRDSSTVTDRLEVSNWYKGRGGLAVTG
jgi:hypothetical protein